MLYRRRDGNKIKVIKAGLYSTNLLLSLNSFEENKFLEITRNGVELTSYMSEDSQMYKSLGIATESHSAPSCVCCFLLVFAIAIKI